MTPGGYTNYKTRKVKPIYPALLESFMLPQRFGDTTGPGPGGAIASPQMSEVKSGFELDAARGYITGAQHQNPWRGMRGMAPRGSSGNVGYAFMGGPNGSIVQEDTKTGYYSPAAGESTVVSTGSENIHYTSTETVVNDQGTAAMDFRVETDSQTHGIFSDASANYIGIRKSVPVSGLDLGASLGTPITTTLIGLTLTDVHHVVLCDATSGGFFITLPTAVGIAGREYHVKKIDSSANAVEVDGASAEKIDNDLTYKLTCQWQSLTIKSNGTQWYIL